MRAILALKAEPAGRALVAASPGINPFSATREGNLMADRESPGVLVVDDQAEIRALLPTILRHHGFTVWLAPGGPEAIELYRQQRDRVNLILLDVAMPDWDGPRTLKSIRRENPAAVICFVTGATAEYPDAALI